MTRTQIMTVAPAGFLIASQRQHPSLLVHAKRHNGSSASAVGFFHLSQKNGFQPAGINRHFTSCNLFVCSAMKTQFADAQSAFGSHWRPKDPAGHRAGRIKVTGAGFGIKHRTRLVLGQISEHVEPALAFFAVIESPRDHIPAIATWKPCKPAYGFSSTLADTGCASGIAHFKLGQTLLQASGIKLVDGKRPHAALGASFAANQPLAALACNLGERCVRNLDQLVVAGRE
jgi:hypothetical protein